MPSTARPTMNDVAKRSGVSLKTVSRVINGEPGVAPETAERVQQAVAELGYQTDLQARSLRRGDRRSQSLGLLVSSVANPFDSEIHRAVELAAEQHQAIVLASSSGNDPRAERRRVSALLQRHVDGLIVSSVGRDQSWIAAMAGSKPLVFVDREPSELLADAVVSDHQVGALRATRHLLSHGHERIALLADDEIVQSARARRAGYEEALVGAGMTVDPEMVRMGLTSEPMGRMAAHELLTAPEPPTAIFASQNHLAMGAIRAIHYLGLDGTVALVSFDDVPYGDLFPVPLTAITQDPTRIGEIASDRLFRRIAGDLTGPPELIVVPTGFEVRGSGEIRPQ